MEEHWIQQEYGVMPSEGLRRVWEVKRQLSLYRVWERNARSAEQQEYHRLKGDYYACLLDQMEGEKSAVGGDLVVRKE
jgi:hypothetical protein